MSYQSLADFCDKLIADFLYKSSDIESGASCAGGIACEEAKNTSLERLTTLVELEYKSNEIISEGKSLNDIMLDIVSKPRFQNDNILSFLHQLSSEVSTHFPEADGTILLRAINASIRKLNNTPSPDVEIEIDLPPELNTEKALILWKKAKAAGLVDSRYQPTGSQYEAALLADRMSELLDLKPNKKWSPFAKFWNIKYLRQRHQDALFQVDYAEKVKKINKIISW